MMNTVSVYLKAEMVPQRLIDEMMSRSSTNIYWMSNDDIDQLGEYSPGLEEMLISRCNYKTLKEMTARPSDKQREYYAAFQACLLKLEEEKFMDQSVAFYSRLKKGWRPWSK